MAYHGKVELSEAEKILQDCVDLFPGPDYPPAICRAKELLEVACKEIEGELYKQSHALEGDNWLKKPIRFIGPCYADPMSSHFIGVAEWGKGYVHVWDTGAFHTRWYDTVEEATEQLRHDVQHRSNPWRLKGESSSEYFERSRRDKTAGNCPLCHRESLEDQEDT